MHEAFEQGVHERLHRQPWILVGVGDPEPPPRSTTAGVQSSSARQSAAKAASQSIASARRPLRAAASRCGRGGPRLQAVSRSARSSPMSARESARTSSRRARWGSPRGSRPRCPASRARAPGGHPRPPRARLVGRVEHDEAAGVRRRRELLVRLVVAVEHDRPRHRCPRGARTRARRALTRLRRTPPRRAGGARRCSGTPWCRSGLRLRAASRYVLARARSVSSQ